MSSSQTNLFFISPLVQCNQAFKFPAGSLARQARHSHRVSTPWSGRSLSLEPFCHRRRALGARQRGAIRASANGRRARARSRLSPSLSFAPTVLQLFLFPIAEWTQPVFLPPSLSLSHNSYRVVRQIGVGTYGSVWEAVDRETGDTVS